LNNEPDKIQITREAVLSAAESEFAEKGFFGARVDEIARESGVNKRIIYKMFVSKEELYKIVLYKAYEKMAKAESEIFTEYSTCEEAIKKVVKSYFDRKKGLDIKPLISAYDDQGFMSSTKEENASVDSNEGAKE